MKWRLLFLKITSDNLLNSMNKDLNCSTRYIEWITKIKEQVEDILNLEEKNLESIAKKAGEVC